MKEIWGKSTLVRVNKGLSYRESTVFATLKSSSQSIHDHFYS